MDIYLFSINGETKERWWIGCLKNVKIIDINEADEIIKIYKQKGWISEMKDQIQAIGGNVDLFEENPYVESFLNIKFKPEDAEILEEPIKISKNDEIIKATYLSSLYYYEGDPKLEVSKDNIFKFKFGHNPQKERFTLKRKYLKKELKITHNIIQNSVYAELVEKYGSENVSTENDTGLGTMIDIVLKNYDNFTFYEIKSDNSIRSCVRHGISQLLEYAFFPNNNRSNKLIIISPNPPNNQIEEYLKKLRKDFNIPIYYQQFDLENKKLIDKLI